jgi:hypothetical protein
VVDQQGQKEGLKLGLLIVERHVLLILGMIAGEKLKMVGLSDIAT